MLKQNQNTALTSHVLRFMRNDRYYDSQTVQNGLEKIHGEGAKEKGSAIATFNATHSQPSCTRHSQGNFTTDTNGSYARHLHLGTTRIWTVNGGIDESRWKKFVDFVTKGQENEINKVVYQSRLKKYLNKCLENDAPDLTTGRHAEGRCSLESVQAFAATSAWDEVYERLTCGWGKTKSGEADPYIDLSLVRLFFENSEKAFMKAETQELPVPRPDESISDEDMSRSVFAFRLRQYR